MLNLLPSARTLRRLNRRQRKKLRVGEFQELVFEVRVQFRQPMDDAAHDAFWMGSSRSSNRDILLWAEWVAYCH